MAQPKPPDQPSPAVILSNGEIVENKLLSGTRIMSARL
jgi:hypothetical protein